MQPVSVHQLTNLFFRSVAKLQKSNKYYLYIFKTGGGLHHIDEHQSAIKSESLHFIYPFQKQEFSNVKQCSGYCIEFTEDFFHLHTEHKDVLYRLPFLGYELKYASYKIPKRSFDQFYDIADLMYEEFHGKKIYHDKILLSYINIFLMKFKQLPGIRNERLDGVYYTSMQIVVRYKRLIRQHYSKHHSVAWYAKQLNQTTNYLNNVVKEVTGKRAGDLIYVQLIMEAKRLLLHTKLSLKEIAFDIGFKDASYFTKFFKKHTGSRPLDWFRKYK